MRAPWRAIGTSSRLTGSADELEHPEYEHARAVRLARELFDAGIAVVEIIDEEVRGTASPRELRVLRGATLSFMETGRST